MQYKVLSKKKILAYLQLVRLPNIFTAVADVLAGYLVFCGEEIFVGDLLLLMLTSACIYGGGCAYNDLCDFELDSRERPHRPLPSGCIAKREALILILILTGGAIVAAALVGIVPLLIALILIGLVFSYDQFSKDVKILGSLNMAACRGGNLLLGMAVFKISGLHILFVMLSTWYVFWLTSVSNFETGGAPGLLKWGYLGGITVTFFVPVWLVGRGDLLPVCLVFLLLLAVLVGRPLLRWLSTPGPTTTSTLVKFLVLGIPLLDAVYVSAIKGWLFALPVLFCLVLALFWSKCLSVA